MLLPQHWNLLLAFDCKGRASRAVRTMRWIHLSASPSRNGVTFIGLVVQSHSPVEDFLLVDQERGIIMIDERDIDMVIMLSRNVFPFCWVIRYCLCLRSWWSIGHDLLTSLAFLYVLESSHIGIYSLVSCSDEALNQSSALDHHHRPTRCWLRFGNVQINDHDKNHSRE